MSRRDLGSWLEGPRSAPDPERRPPGVRLGLPAEGPGSVASFGRRLLGLAVDWAAAVLIAQGLLRGLDLGSLGPLLVLFVEHAVLVGTAGFSLGHRVAGLRVVSLRGGGPGLPRAVVRAFLLVLAVPPLIWDADQRGLHDKAAGTVVVRR